MPHQTQDQHVTLPDNQRMWNQQSGTPDGRSTQHRRWCSASLDQMERYSHHTGSMALSKAPSTKIFWLTRSFWCLTALMELATGCGRRMAPHATLQWTSSSIWSESWDPTGFGQKRFGHQTRPTWTRWIILSGALWRPKPAATITAVLLLSNNQWKRSGTTFLPAPWSQCAPSFQDWEVHRCWWRNFWEKQALKCFSWVNYKLLLCDLHVLRN